MRMDAYIRSIGWICFVVLVLACGKKEEEPQLQSGGPNLPSGCDPSKPFTYGAGTAVSPYLVYDACDFSRMTKSQYASSHFRLAQDVDLTDLNDVNTIYIGGSFDGNDHIVHHWTGKSALFYENSGVIQNLTVQNFSINGGVKTGILVGRNAPTGVVQDCAVLNSSITGTFFFTAGLVAVNEGTIQRSRVIATLAGTGYVGGLVANNKGTISDSFAIAPLVGSNTLGGLVAVSTAGSITRCYAAGAVTGTGIEIGGLVGRLDGGTVTDSYWDMESSGQPASAAGVGKMTSQMIQTVTYTNWDFTNIWLPPTFSYPQLR